ncbi:MAG TPA: type II toxin-antitoxin system prevent-host-death family antitoxin [Nakamurella sp.]
MDSVSVRDLRNHGGEVLDRVQQGESLTVTRDGAPVAELRPVRRRGVPTAELVRRRRSLPPMDADALRRDLDRVLDSGV